MSRREQIIPSSEVTRVHAHANFGSMTPREVIDEGIKKVLIGYSCGSTQEAILQEHGLVSFRNQRTRTLRVTAGGMNYARAMYQDGVLYADPL